MKYNTKYGNVEYTSDDLMSMYECRYKEGFEYLLSLNILPSRCQLFSIIDPEYTKLLTKYKCYDKVITYEQVVSD